MVLLHPPELMDHLPSRKTDNNNTASREQTKGNSTFSLAFLFLCLFTITNFYSPRYYLGDAFARLPIILASVAACFYFLSSLNSSKKKFRTAFPLFWLLIIWLFAGYSTFVVSVDPERSKETFEYLSKNFILFILISQIARTPKQVKYYIVVLCICAVGNAYKLSHYPIWDSGRAWLHGTAFGGDPNIISLLFIYTLPLVVTMIPIHRNILIRTACLGSIYILLLGLIEAQSRGGFLALLVMTIFGIFTIKPWKKQLITAVFVLSFEVLFFLRYAPNDYIARMNEIVAPQTDQTGSAQARMSAMTMALHYTLSHPLSEYGLGNHSYYVASQYGADKYQEGGIFHGSYLVHNILLQIGADLGLVPLIIYLCFILSLFNNLRSSYKIFYAHTSAQAQQCAQLSQALAASLSGLLTGSFFLAGAYQPFILYIGGCCLALFLTAKDLQQTKQPPHLEENQKIYPAKGNPPTT